MAKWIRPESVNFPSIWVTFESKNIINGFRRKFWIQDLTDEYTEEVIHRMSTEFLLQETLLKHARISEDPQSLEELQAVWRRMIDQKVSLICLTKEENDITRLVGCNILAVSQKHDTQEESANGKALAMVLNSIHDVYKMKDIYYQLNVDTYLNALGLYVVPEYRGEGIGTEIVKARRQLSLAVGLKASVTVFTSIGGQRSAEKAGFKDIIEFPYKDLKKLDPSYEFTGIEDAVTKTMRVMYDKYSD